MAMSRTSHQPTGGRRSSPVRYSGMSYASLSHGARDTVGDARDIDHLPHAMNADDVGAEQNACRPRRCRAPFALFSGAGTEGLRQERLAGRAAKQRTVQRAESIELGDGFVGVLGAF